jgi:hypothetical protein
MTKPEGRARPGDRSQPEEEDFGPEQFKMRPGRQMQFTMGQGSGLEANVRAYAREFLQNCGLKATPDAMDQLVEVFLPCLAIMCQRPWDPQGGTWKKSGIFGVMTDTRKKFERFWERLWVHGKRHDDSGYDLINYVGMVMRADPYSGWGQWGAPANPAPPEQLDIV